MSAEAVTNTLVQNTQQEVKQSRASIQSTFMGQFYSIKRDPKATELTVSFRAIFERNMENLERTHSDPSSKDHELLKSGRYRFFVMGKVFYARADDQDVNVLCPVETMRQGGYFTIIKAFQLSMKTKEATEVVLKRARDDTSGQRLTGKKLAVATQRLEEARVQLQISIQTKQALPKTSQFVNEHFAVYSIKIENDKYEDAYVEEMLQTDMYDKVEGLYFLNDSRAERVKWAKSAFKGLQTMHEKGILHCDFKLENLLQDKNGEVSITDFGTAMTQSSVYKGIYVVRFIQQKFAEWLGEPKGANDTEYFGKAKVIDLMCYANCAYSLLRGGKLIFNVTEYTSQETIEQRIQLLEDRYSKETVEFFKKYFLCKGIPDFTDFAKDVEKIGLMEEEQKKSHSEAQTSVTSSTTTVSSTSATTEQISSQNPPIQSTEVSSVQVAVAVQS